MLTLTTPALLFPAISLLLLAYTNRFLTLAQLIRKLHGDYQSTRQRIVFEQLKNLRLRVRLIRDMQVYGVTSLLGCVVTMFLLYANAEDVAAIIFGMSLILLIFSLAYSIYEVYISIRALNIQLQDLAADKKD